MNDSTALLNVGELSKPATVLVEKISDAIGGIFKPWQIRRVAQAEGEAEKIKAVARIETTKLERRALQRFIVEEAKKQNNIESITKKALPYVEQNALPQNMEDDWITNFFDKCRLISDEEMQIIWSRILAGEANSPGTFSKRTVNFLGSLDRSDASLFQSLCGFCVNFGTITPLVFSTSADIYNKHGIDFSNLQHLDEIGLLSFDHLSGYKRIKLPKKLSIFYFGEIINIEFEKEIDNELSIGKAILSKVGQELAPICEATAIPEFYDYLIDEWKPEGVIVKLPYQKDEQEQPKIASK